ncbi:MAG: hypothetical protein ACRCXM_07930 [Beijerinckiaceae bacterium]
MIRKIALVLALAVAAAATLPALTAEAGSYNGKSCSNRTSGDMKKGYSC